MIRLATLQDIPDVVAIYDALHTLEEQGKAVIGWHRGVYPTRKHAVEALEAGQLYVDDQDGLIPCILGLSGSARAGAGYAYLGGFARRPGQRLRHPVCGFLYRSGPTNGLYLLTH